MLGVEVDAVEFEDGKEGLFFHLAVLFGVDVLEECLHLQLGLVLLIFCRQLRYLNKVQLHNHPLTVDCAIEDALDMLTTDFIFAF